VQARLAAMFYIVRPNSSVTQVTLTVLSREVFTQLSTIQGQSTLKLTVAQET